MNTYYDLDRENYLIGTGGDWDDFALANNGEDATTPRILARPIWDFVDGHDTMSFLNAVFFWCRQRQADFATTYRCDSDTEARYYNMQVEPFGNGFLRVSSALSSKSQMGIRAVPSIVETLHNARCSMCCRFRVGDQWVDPFAQPSPRYFPSSHVICSSCKKQAWHGLNHASSMRSEPVDIIQSA